MPHLKLLTFLFNRHCWW